MIWIYIGVGDENMWICIGVGDENYVDLYWCCVEENDVDLYWCRKWCGFMLMLVKKMVWIYIGAGEGNGVDVGDENDVKK
ncbi:hypothetical protein Glove_132g127 [Diversispora epigaea]|uniref:Uncharacterized protein n=1 Tax=Diversispora epigaea TaxID=1348612 RepID=A0A397J299_9GLOM|nr:hypothetical protein Glove_132g127 [Diversispora epigaea]